jgi:hypothetical protein
MECEKCAELELKYRLEQQQRIALEREVNSLKQKIVDLEELIDDEKVASGEQWIPSEATGNAERTQRLMARRRNLRGTYGRQRPGKTPEKKMAPKLDESAEDLSDNRLDAPPSPKYSDDNWSSGKEEVMDSENLVATAFENLDMGTELESSEDEWSDDSRNPNSSTPASEANKQNPIDGIIDQNDSGDDSWDESDDQMDKVGTDRRCSGSFGKDKASRRRSSSGERDKASIQKKVVESDDRMDQVGTDRRCSGSFGKDKASRRRSSSGGRDEASIQKKVVYWARGKTLQEMLMTVGSVFSGRIAVEEHAQNGTLQINDDAARIRKLYLRQIRLCHPDKLPSDSSDKTKIEAALVFSVLTEAYSAAKSE